MPICARCGQPLDALPAKPGCPSCTWRAALRASKAVVTDTPPSAATTNALATRDDSAVAPIDDLDIGADDPLALMERLFAFAGIAGEDLGDAARRIYLALLRGNPRPYRTKVNRLVDRYIDRLEDAWTA